MLLIGIIRGLSRQLELNSHLPHLSYFYIQGTDSKLNTATAVLRSLIWMTLLQNPSLISHLEKEYDPTGPRYFETNIFQALSKVFDNMLVDPSLSRVYLIVDALDECVDKQRTSYTSTFKLRDGCKIIELVSSRYRSDIESQLRGGDGWARLDLELNAQSISRVVDAYIDYKLSKLNYDEPLRAQVADELHKRADGTFLWVALVCKTLELTDDYYAIEILQEMPSDLKSLYLIGSIMTLAYQPLRLSELASLANLPPNIPLMRTFCKQMRFISHST